MGDELTVEQLRAHVIACMDLGFKAKAREIIETETNPSKVTLRLNELVVVQVKSLRQMREAFGVEVPDLKVM
jgi:hypothetical protein